MSDPSPTLDPEVHEHAEGLASGADALTEEGLDRRLAEIEMAGEEVAVGWKPAAHAALSPEVRYLHISRTIHQLVTDRNRSVGIFLAVASLLFAASTALLNVEPTVVPIIPLKAIQYWCLPVTFGTLAVLGGFISLLLIRARIGLIYEVTKMNTLLGLPTKRVERVNPLSIFYLMHLLVVREPEERFLAADVAAGAKVTMRQLGRADGSALRPMHTLILENQLPDPSEFTEQGGSIFGVSRRYRYTQVSTFDYRQSILQQELERAQAQLLGAQPFLPRTYLAVVKQPPELSLGLDEVERQGDFHMLIGRW